MTRDAGVAADWRPVAGVATARLRATMLDDARQHFAREGVLLVDTPALSRCAVSDPNIESVHATLKFEPSADFFLHTSPEFCMKRMLAAGFPDIGQICRVFRDGESGRRHQPEFTMIEWYRRNFGLDAMLSDTERMLALLLGPDGLAAEPLRLSYREAFLEYAGIDPFIADTSALAGRSGADPALAESIGDDRDAWLDLLMVSIVAPAFPSDRLTSLSHYPASQAALARHCPADPALADRFEVYCGNVELANGYVELTDSSEQLRRLHADQESRRRRGRLQRPLDMALVQALEAGLPDCAGVAVGFDRLLMIRAGKNDIRQVQHFPHEAS